MTGSELLETKPAQFRDKILNAPLLPGCYRYKDARGRILYIGKAKVLRARVRSYFNNFPRLEERIRQMLLRAVDIEYLITDSEIEALILEANLIKKYKPKYNSALVDDKSYIYVKFPKVRATKPGEKIQIPTIETTREKLNDGATYFGPYPNAFTVKRLLQRLRRIFPYCTSNAKVGIPARKSDKIIANNKPCFYYQLELCNGTCAGYATRGEMENNLHKIEQFFRGEKNKIVQEFESAMKQAAQKQQYEEAAKYRNMLRDIQYVGSQLRVDKDVDEIAVMAEKKDRQARALDDLIEYLQFPKQKLQNHEGFRMECYDISNIQGRYAVGSMVVFIDGQARPDLYRRFRIQMKNEPNDFAMLREVLTRRFHQLLRSQNFHEHNGEIALEYTDTEGFTKTLPKELQRKVKSWKPDPSFEQQPDLIIIDGGKGQLSSTYRILQAFGLADTIPMVGLAKREEDIFKVNAQFSAAQEKIQDDFEIPTGKIADEDYTKIHLPRRAEALYLVQRIRDEAHRFGITYHRKVRSKAFLTEGLTPKSKE